MSNQIINTRDGSHSIQSEKFGVSYHSIHGAIQETQHVFIDAGLNQKKELETISILEIGMGTALNIYMTWLENHELNRQIQFVSYEAYPIRIEQAESLNYPSIFNQPTDSFLQFHQLEWNIGHQLSNGFHFTKYQKDFQEINDVEQYDIIYFDAFAPNAQAEFWEEPFLAKMFNALKPAGILVTYCAKGSFKRALKGVGFQVEKLPGPPGKREMTRAIKPSV